MKKANLRNGQTLGNKLNGKKYLYNGDTGIATEILPQDEEGNNIGVAETVVLNESNAVCFYVVEDPNFDEYKLDENGFFCNGNEVITGEIKVVSIIAAGKKKALLAVAQRESDKNDAAAEDRYDIFLYNGLEDKFTKYKADIALGETIDLGDLVVIPFQNTEKRVRKVKQADGTEVDEEYIVLTKSGFLEFGKTASAAGYVSGYDVIGEFKGKIALNDGSTELIFATDKAAGVYEDADGYDDDDDEYDDDEYDDDDDNFESDDNSGSCNGYEIKPVEGKIVIRVLRIGTNGYMTVGKAVTLDGEFDSVTRAGRSLIYKSTKEIVTEKGRITAPKAVAALAGYNFLVKETKDGDIQTITMANSSYETKAVKITNTPDRGQLVETI